MMIRFLSLSLVAAAAATAGAVSIQHVSHSQMHPTLAHPTVIELFQSQGCSSCPPALNVLAIEADRPDVIALNFAVTYWDQLGWKDRFAKPAFTARQWDYARFNGRSEVATPQLVINGSGIVNGGDRQEVDRAIGRFAATRPGPSLTVRGAKLLIGSGTLQRLATVWLVSYDPRTLNVAIGSGENAGRTLPHRNVVRDLAELGSWRGAAKSFPLPPALQGLRRAVLVEEGQGGPIIAASLIN